MSPGLKIFLTASAAAIPIILSAHPYGAPPRVTGAPGDATCLQSGCHTGTLTPNSNAIALTFPNGLTYTPGVSQRITVTAHDPAEIFYGFEMSARLSSDLANGQAGDLVPADSIAAYTECDGPSDQDATYFAPCPAGAAVQFVTHSMPSTTGAWQVDWTPPAAGAGSVTIYLAVNAGHSTEQEDKHIHLQSYTLSPASSSGPTIEKVVNGASFQNGLTPGAWFTVTGTGLSSTIQGRIWGAADLKSGLPLSMDKTSVTVDGKTAYMEYVSPTQLNAVAPMDLATGQMVDVVVTLNGQASAAVQVPLLPVAPAFFTLSPGTAEDGKYPAAQHVDNTYVGRVGLFPSAPALTHPAAVGETIILWGTGFGPTQPQAPDGHFVSAVSLLVPAPIITIGGVSADVQFAGLVPPYAALYQFNVVVPTGLPAGDAKLEADLGNGVLSPNAFLTIGP